MRLPKHYFEQELLIKNLLTQRLQRGKVNVSVSVHVHGAENAPVEVSVDADLLAAYYKELDSVRRTLGIQQEIALSTLLSLPGAVSEPDKPVTEEEWALVQQALEKATTALVASRQQEGSTLVTELTLRINEIEKLQAQLPPLEAERIETVKTRLSASLQEFLQGREIDADRFNQELIYYLEKNDITEEQVRLRAHLALFRQTMAEGEGQGRKLGFVTQEIGREINTLGSKAYHAGMQRLVVQMKDELEKIKEQINNIL